ncbi:MAG TPA: cytochrome c oxidase subunit 3 [Casimicrobiaceae bacterium]|jgi:heme/copper-type cytochrome/quinol oxidase subunit 3
MKRREFIPGSVPAVRRGDALDVAALPSYGFAHRSLMWWGNAGMMAIEGVAFGFMIIIYFYLRSLAKTWPDAGQPPDLLFGNINLAIIIVSALPNYLAQRAAADRDIRRVRLWLYVNSFFAAALCAIRWFEFTHLNVRWDDGAYGSVVWVLLGVHTFNLVTDFGDTLVLTAVTYAKPFEGKRFVDIAENCGYWYFVVLTWLPIYAVIYFGARF